ERANSADHPGRGAYAHHEYHRLTHHGTTHHAAVGHCTKTTPGEREFSDHGTSKLRERLPTPSGRTSPRRWWRHQALLKGLSGRPSCHPMSHRTTSRPAVSRTGSVAITGRLGVPGPASPRAERQRPTA